MRRGIVLTALASWIVAGAVGMAAARPAALKRPVRRLSLEAGGGALTFLTFSPDGRRVAGVRTSVGPTLTFSSVGSSSQVLVWNVKTGRLERFAHVQLLKSVQFSPDGESLVGLYPGLAGQEVGSEDGAFSVDGHHVGQKYGLMLWRLKQKTPLTPSPLLDLAGRELPYDPAGPRRAEFAGRADAIAVSLLNGLRVWTVSTVGDGVELHEDESRDHTQPWAKYQDVRISSDGSKVIVVDGGFSTRDSATRKRIGGWPGRQGRWLTVLGLSSDGGRAFVELVEYEPVSTPQFIERMTTGGQGQSAPKALQRSVGLVSTGSGGMLHETSLPRQEQHVVGWAKDGTRIVTIATDGALRVRDLAENTVVAEDPRLGSVTACAALSYDGSLLVTSSSTGEVALWNLPKPPVMKTAHQPGE